MSRNPFELPTGEQKYEGDSIVKKTAESETLNQWFLKVFE